MKKKSRCYEQFAIIFIIILKTRNNANNYVEEREKKKKKKEKLGDQIADIYAVTFWPSIR